MFWILTNPKNPPLKSARWLILFVVITTAAYLIAGCAKHRNTSEGMEGKIIYDLSYPYEKSSIMMDLYPKEMIVYFKGDKLHSEIKSSYDLLTTDFIIDNEQRTFAQLLKNVSKKSGLMLNESQTKEWYSRYPEYAFEHLPETEVICGYVCNKTIAKALNTDLPPVTIYHTRGLGLGCDNWWNPYNGVDGFLMAYDVEQYGMCMRMRVKEVVFEAVEDSHFAIPSEYNITDPSTFDTQLDAVVKEYMN